MKSFSKQVAEEFPRTDIKSIDLLVGVLPMAVFRQGCFRGEVHPGIGYTIISNNPQEKPFIGNHGTDTFWEYHGIGLILELFKKNTPENINRYSRARGVARAQREAQLLKEHYGNLVTVNYIEPTFCSA